MATVLQASGREEERLAVALVDAFSRKSARDGPRLLRPSVHTHQICERAALGVD